MSKRSLVLLVGVLSRRKWHYMEPSKLAGRQPAVLTQMRIDDSHRVFDVGPYCPVDFRVLRRGQAANFTGTAKKGRR